eukprot:TRINITY_DN3040_c0_g1_i14.p1 TRINITY_DN3040_c0_g1~~TRINITY_DN3040_c0_g1_i14.p1  ORF type:complete len:176 (-),score=45.97 TRINITY_DN3040_c0_g1_i14:133-660(-)
MSDEEKKRGVIQVQAQMAVAAKFMADLPLKGKHRAVCFNNAVSRNIHAGNYGVAARMMEVLLQHANDKKKVELQKKLEACEKRGFRDHTWPRYECPVCSTALSGGVTSCPTCSHGVRFCYDTFELLTKPTSLKCDACSATFSLDNEEEGSQCRYCFVSALRLSVLKKVDLEDEGE